MLIKNFMNQVTIHSLLSFCFWSSIIVTVRAVIASGCSENFPTKLAEKNCMFLSTKVASYCNAQLHCQSIGGEIFSGEEQLEALHRIYTRILRKENAFYYWRYLIGLTDVYQEGEYRWTTNGLLRNKAMWSKPLFYSQEPNGGHMENCVKYSGALEDTPCTDTSAYICQPKPSNVLSSKKTFVPRVDVVPVGRKDPGCYSDVTKVTSKVHCGVLCRRYTLQNCNGIYYKKASNECVLILFIDSISETFSIKNGWNKYV